MINYNILKLILRNLLTVLKPYKISISIALINIMISATVSIFSNETAFAGCLRRSYIMIKLIVCIVYEFHTISVDN